MANDPLTCDTRPDWVSDNLFPFESRFVGLDGHHLHYVDEGDGPTLLMLHGNPTWSFVYRDVIAALRGQFRCLALDYPGFGLSEPGPGYGFKPAEHAAVVAGFVERLGLNDVTLVAQDWGGPIGLWAAQQSPDRYRALVLANTWGWPVNGDLHFEFFSRMMGGLLGRELIRSLNLFVNLMVPVGHRRRRVTGQEMAHYRAALATRERRHASAVLPHAILESRAFLSEVEEHLTDLDSKPALLIRGDRDIAFRDRERQRWEATLTNSTTVQISGAGHFVQSDAPVEFANAIRDWLASRAAADTRTEPDTRTTVV